MSFMPGISDNVAAILSILSGGSAEVSTGVLSVMSPYQIQALEYMSKIPAMSDDIAAIRTMLGNVIKPNGVASGYRIVTS